MRCNLVESFTFLVIWYGAMLHFAERSMISVLVDDIKNEFKVGNTKYGLSHSTLLLGHSIASLFFGYIGDKLNRRYPIVGGIGIGTFANLFCTFATNYPTFLLSRFFFGVGEAALMVASIPTVGELFHGEYAILTIAGFLSCIPVGTGLGYIIIHFVDVKVEEWRGSMRSIVFAHIFTLIFGCIMTLPHSIDQLIHADTYGPDLCRLLCNRSIWLIIFSKTVISFVFEIMHCWYYHFVRTIFEDVDPQWAFFAGTMEILVGAPAILGEAFLFYLHEGRNNYARPVILFLSSLISLILCTYIIYLPFQVLEKVTIPYVILYICYIFLFYISFSIVLQMLLNFVPPSIHCTTIAFAYCGWIIFGSIFGPWLIGYITDHHLIQILKNPDNVPALAMQNALLIPPLIAAALSPLNLILIKLLGSKAYLGTIRQKIERDCAEQTRN